MQSSHGKSRWRQAVDADDELLLPVSRTDDDHVVPYSRSHHHSNRSNTQKTSSSDRYRNPETSLSHRQNGDWRTDDGTHSSNRDRYDDDEYTYTRRDKYVDTHNSHIAQDSRHHDERTNQSSRHSHKDWRNPEDVHTTSPHVENGSWATSSRHGRNGNDLDDYIPTESSHERGKGRYERDPGYSTKDDQSTRRGKERKHDGEDRRSRDGHSDDRLLQSASRERPQVEERSWEPAASWKPRERSVHIQTSDGHSNRSNNKRNSKDLNQSRRNQHTQRRDRRDDSDMNNWQKRDFNSIKKIPTGNTSSSKTSTKRKQAHSPILSRSRSPSHSPSRSRSRSRSPAYSTYSYRSSIRSRSRSFSPKRRKYDKRDRFIPNSSYRESRKGQRYERRSPPSSPLPRRGDDARARPRRPSISSVSSRSRSPSTSPLRSRTKHRLPTATTLRDIDLSAKNVSRLLHTSDRVSHKQKNGRHSAVTDKKASYPSPRDSDLRPATQRAPKSPSFLNEHPHETSVNENHVSPKFNRKGKGFKPIGKPPSSASVRKFFPGDDDESDVSPHQQRNRSPTPPAHSPVYDTRDKITPTDDKSNRVHYSEEAHDKRKSPPISHRAPATVEIPIQPPNHEIHPSEPTQSNLRHRHEEEQIHYEAAPKTIRKMLPGGVYGIVSQVGEGTFGQVYKAQNAVSGVYVALKRIRMETERDGFPVTAMREIKLLQSLRHSNVVHLYEMMVSQGSVYMVFEYMDHDLTGLLSQPQFVFSDAHLKSFCYQMLSGLAYLHHKGVIHRDIKGSNILINNLGELKLGDFGLARFYQKRRRSDYTNRVITLWYRPPELLFGATVYGPEVDMWSAGCIMLELFCKKPVFQGNDEIHQLDVIYKVMGTPTPNEWSGLAELPWYELVKPRDTIRNHFREYFQKWLSPAGLDLAELLLAYDPARRMTAAQALETSYFKQEGPPPEQPAGLSSLGTEWHEYESKRERARKKRKLEGMQGGSELQ